MVNSDQRTLVSKISQAQNNNSKALEELIVQFSPLLRKYASFLKDEDAFFDLQVDFIGVVMQINPSAFSSVTDYPLLSYIEKCVRNSYIKYSKQRCKCVSEIHYEDFTDCEKIKFDSLLSILDQHQALFFNEIKNIISFEAFDIIVKHYIFEKPIQDIANEYGTSRQNINKIKNNALKKLRFYLGQN